MKDWKREVFFWTLVVLFLITAPVIILNAKGYRFDTNRGVFVHSGTITFKSNPQTVDIKINNEPFEARRLNIINNSYSLSGLIPGEYNFEISAHDFRPWSKNVKVHSGVASEFWNILLVRNNYEKTDFNTVGIEKFFISPKNNLLAYITTKENDLLVKVLNLENNEIEKELDFLEWQFLEEQKKENIEWSPNNAFLSIPVKRKIQLDEYEYNYFIYDFKAENKINLAEISSKKNIHDARWDPKENNHLFFMDGSDLFRINIKNPQEIVRISSDVSSYNLSETYIYYANDSSLIFKKSLTGEDAPIQITSSFPQSQNSKIATIVAYDDLRIALILENKDFYLRNSGERGDYFRKLGENIEESHFSSDGKKILFWSSNEIYVYFLRDQLSQPVRQENEIQNITRYSEPIKNVQWFSDYEHIIFNSGKFIKIIEIDPRDQLNCMDLVNTQNQNPFVIYNNLLEKLYFIDNKNDTSSLYSINFPEKNIIFGVEVNN
ncbi:MAG: hypothetical protein COX29_01475 [Candidatus Moranbacteria bacterium CG23_combo_of_CG06-09_8_20_14_all_35_22]|nr:MAG: hypothetical protein COX29_01475 [Candidatus Moranbacteria bacterium CG23_combo_of_CG06-09_8_20_14_all_35_22]